MTTEERLEELERKKREYVKQINAQKEKIRRANKKKDRAERDHRLIEIGAILESNLGVLDESKRIALNDFLKRKIATTMNGKEVRITIIELFENYYNWFKNQSKQQ